MAPSTGRSSSPDPIRRRAAIIATLVAVPVALAVLLVSVFVLSSPEPPAPQPTGSVPTEPVTVAARDLSPEATGLCQAVIADLPDTAAGQPRRPVTAGSEQNAAYGDPPIIVECGTTLPEVGDTDLVYPLSGVCWYSVTEADRTVWTTVDRTVPVTVTVPGPPDGAAQYVVPLSTAIRDNLPARDTAPSGCFGPVPTAS